MHEVFTVADGHVGATHQAIETGRSVVGDDAESAAVALDLGRFARLQYVVEHAIDVLAQLRCGRNWGAPEPYVAFWGDPVADATSWGRRL